VAEQVHTPVTNAAEPAAHGKIAIATMAMLQCLTEPSRFVIIVQVKAENGIHVTIQTAMPELFIAISAAAAETKPAALAAEMVFSKGTMNI